MDKSLLGPLNEREELISAVEHGRMTVQEAEAKALELGLVTLLPSHPPELFDPMTQERWTLLMAVVWVLARSPTAVRNSWDAFLTTQYQWNRVGLFGPLRAERRSRQWVHSLPLGRPGEMMFADLPGRSFSVSWTLLRLSLSNGAVTAWGRDLRKGDEADVSQIPRQNWSALVLAGMPAKDGVLPHAPGEDMLHFGNGNPVYASLAVDRATLLTAFPAADVASEGQPISFDPVQQVTNSAHAAESSAQYKKRIRCDAIRKLFPNGKPPSMGIKQRNKDLDDEVLSVDRAIGLADRREWARLWGEIHGE